MSAMGKSVGMTLAKVKEQGLKRKGTRWDDALPSGNDNTTHLGYVFTNFHKHIH